MTPASESSDVILLDSFSRELETVSKEYSYCRAERDDLRKCLSRYRDIAAKYWGSIESMHSEGASGARICFLLSSLADRLLLHAIHETGLDDCKNGALVALGGYGREELNPYSDIDILFLFRDTPQNACETTIQLFVRFLWDLNLQVGQSVRTVAECLEEAREDIDLATSLLESRLLWGNREILEELKVSYGVRLRKGDGKSMAIKKIEEREARLAGHDGTVGIQVPDVKESPGGLRDVHTARWILMFTGISGSFQSLLQHRLLYDFEYAEYLDDFDFLLRVRNAAHFIAGKKSDLLEHTALPDIAANLGYQGSRIERTEAFMCDYYRHAGRVFRRTQHIVGRYRKRFELPVARDLRSDPSGLVIIDTSLGFSANREDILHETPELIMKLFSLAALYNLTISGRATSVIERTIQAYHPDLAAHKPSREIFREIVESRKGIGRAFRLMHEHGVLPLMIPEFSGILWHYQYNFYHAYTTDEHSIRVVEYIDRIEQGSVPSLPELTAIMNDVTAKSALYLAGLLHDVGKGKGRGHSLRGERLAAQALQRLEWDDRTIQIVRFLIREHLLMSHTAQRRDIDDEDTIRDFVQRIGGMNRLRMLTVITFADLMAVSNSALTDWKKTLFLELYRRAMRYFDKGFETSGEHTADQLVRRVLRNAPEGITQQAVRSHLAGLPGQYGRVTTPASIRKHLAGISQMYRDGVWVSFNRSGNMTFLTVIARDYPSALMDICGAITASDIGIVAAQIFTRTDGIIIDTFLVVDGAGDPRIPDEIKREFRDNLTAVTQGRISARDLIVNHRRRWRRRRKHMVLSPPRVSIHNDISEKFTVIDVFANDYTGLLYDILAVLAKFDIDIRSAKIGTDEDQVADAFYVQRKTGGRIDDPEQLEVLTRTLIEALTPAEESPVRS
jgi:[protein-PII] uridylyltransferase